MPAPKPIREGAPTQGPNGPIVLDTEQHHYLREGIEARAAYYGGIELDHSDEAHLTLALAWFRAYWHDRLSRRETNDLRQANRHDDAPTADLDFAA